jgi:transketolase
MYNGTNMNSSQVASLCQSVQRAILECTTEAGSGHPTSSLSAAQIMTALIAGGYVRQDIKDPKNYANDRLIFSKGHAAPLLYSLYHVFGALSREQLMSLRREGSVIEGHPTPAWEMIDVATGSLGQGLSIGLGMALGIKLRIKNKELTIQKPEDEPRVFVLLGDSEVAEGQVWEAAGIASKYQVNNLIAVLDVNRLGQRGETMLAWDVDTYKARFESFGWNAIIIKNGNDIEAVEQALQKEMASTYTSSLPTIFITKTEKGAGVSFLSNQDGWHGKAVSQDQLAQALEEIGTPDESVSGTLQLPTATINPKLPTRNSQPSTRNSQPATTIATREAYGEALVMLGTTDPNVIVLDAETSNSTFADKFKNEFPERFFEMYIAEQNMISVALGFSKLGYEVFASSFAAFLSRAFDQIRMLQYSDANVNIAGSHAGISIGQDGSSQMALEDLSMMKSVLTSQVFYPSDAPSTVALAKIMRDTPGIFYMRTTREKTPVIYDANESFNIGGSKVHGKSPDNKAVVYAAGITLHEAQKAQKTLADEGISIAVVDVYSIKPVDEHTILSFGSLPVIVVEDHYPYGGLGDTVSSVLTSHSLTPLSYHHLCVREIPHSASPAELMKTHKIDAAAIVDTIKSL